jgi:imidazolonepropionase-like amidohydrolase
MWFFLAASIHLQNVDLLTPQGMQQDVTIVMSGAAVQSIHKTPPTVNKDDIVVHGEGTIVTAGIVNADAQLGLAEVSLEKSTRDDGYAGEYGPAFNVADGYDPRSTHIGAERDEGVTQAIVMPSGGPMFGGVGHVVELDGNLRRTGESGPIRDKPCAMRVSLSQQSIGQAGGARGGWWLRLREALDEARAYQQNPRAFVSPGVDARIMSAQHLAALGPVIKGQLPLMVDVDKATDILALLSFAKEQKLQVWVRGGAEAWLVAKELAEARVPVWMQPTINTYPTSFAALQTRRDAARVLHEAGVQVVITSWGADNGTSRARYEAGYAVARGLPSGAALAAITTAPLRLCGRDSDVKEGARANLVMWSGDPFETRTRALKVFIAGVEQTTPSRQRALAERYR